MPPAPPLLPPLPSPPPQQHVTVEAAMRYVAEHFGDVWMVGGGLGWAGSTMCSCGSLPSLPISCP
jgi:hypothetical protein